MEMEGNCLLPMHCRAAGKATDKSESCVGNIGCNVKSGIMTQVNLCVAKEHKRSKPLCNINSGIMTQVNLTVIKQHKRSKHPFQTSVFSF